MIRLLLAARALRAFADGYVAVLLPAYLLALGHGELEVGLLSTVALSGSAIATLAVGRWGARFAGRRLLLAAAVVMAATGLGFAIMSRATVAKETQLGQLVQVPLSPRLNRHLSVVYPKERFHSRLVSGFVQFAKERLVAMQGTEPVRPAA